MRRLPLAALFFLSGALSVRAQDDSGGSPIFVEEEDAKPLCDRAMKAEKEGRWSDAIEAYAKVLRQYPDQVRQLDSKTYQSVRRFVFVQISKFPEEGRKAYRDLNDSMATSLYQQALKEHDRARLQDIADNYFFTSVGDDASERIGDLFADSGRLPDAVFYWERLVTLYPDPDVSLAQVALKWALASRRIGDDAGWEEARKKLLALGGAKVRLGGEEMTAAEAAVKAETVKASGARADDPEAWPRLGGNNSGTRVATGASRNDIRLWSYPEMTPEQAVQAQAAGRAMLRQNMGTTSPALQFYPAAADGFVVLADGATVHVLDIETGDVNWTYPMHPDTSQLFREAMLGAPRVVSMCAPVIADGVVYVNFLPRTVQQGGGGDPEKSWLAAFRLLDGSMLWSTQDTEGLDVWFGSPPVVYGGKVYAAVTSIGQDPEASVVILDAKTGPKPSWRKIFLCSGTRQMNPWGGWQAFISDSPTLAESGGVLFVNTNLGAVAAVHACTGEILWLTAYAETVQQDPRMMRNPREPFANGHGLNPLVVTGGKVYTLTGDTDNFYEFDARTGKRTLTLNVKYPAGAQGNGGGPRFFYGIAGNSAWFAGSSALFSIPFGKIDRTKDSTVATINALTTADHPVVNGRGFLTSTACYASTSMGVYISSVKTSKLLDDPCFWDATKMKGADSGHVLILGKRMIVLSEVAIYGYTDQKSFDAKFAEVLAAEKPNPEELEKHAVACTRSSRWAEAIKDYEKLVATCDDPARVAKWKSQLVSLYTISADKERADAGNTSDADARAKHWTGAIEWYKKALGAATPDDPLGDIFKHMGESYEALSKWPEAVAMYQEILTKYADQVIDVGSGLAEPIRQFATDKISAIIKDHGAEAYKEIEEKAKKLLDDAKNSDTLKELEKLLEDFPNSSIVGPATFELALRMRAKGETEEAASLLVHLALDRRDLPEAPQALAEAASLFAKSGRWDRVEAALTRLERIYPGVKVEIGGVSQACETVAASIRAGEPMPPEDPDRSKLPAPFREYEALAEHEAIIAGLQGQVVRIQSAPGILEVRGRWAKLDPARVLLLTRLGGVEARDVVTDQPVWTSGDPRGWLGIQWKMNPQNQTVSRQIETVFQGSPADQAGLKDGDTIEAIAGQRMTTVDEMRPAISKAAGKPLDIEVTRKDPTTGRDSRVKLTARIGRRGMAQGLEPVVSATFSDEGLLLVVRATCLEAIDPADGHTVWFHYPCYNGDGSISQVVASDGRVFVTWLAAAEVPNPRVAPASTTQNPVSMEALDAATGKVVWQIREAAPTTLALFAAPGSGTIVRCEKNTAHVLSALSGAELQTRPVLTTADGRGIAATVWDARLYLLSDQNTLRVFDLNTLRETVRDLGGEREYPGSFQVKNGWLVATYGSIDPNRGLAWHAGTDEPNLRFTLRQHKVFTEAPILVSGNRLFIPVVAGAGATQPAGDQQTFQIVAFTLSKDGLKESFGTTTLWMNAVRGVSCDLPGFLFAWGAHDATAKAWQIGLFHDVKGRALWDGKDLDTGYNAARGDFRGAGVQGGMIWVQFEKKVLVFREP